MTKIKILGLVVMAVILLMTPAPAQPPDTLWTKIYGSSYGDEGYSVAQTNDGGYIVAGQIGYVDEPSGDIYLIKTDSLGDTLWTKVFGGSGTDLGLSVAVTDDGGYIIAGLTGPPVVGHYDAYIIKTDANGATLWTKTYGGSEDDRSNSVAQTNDSGYIITGRTDSYGAGYDVYLIKTDANGDSLWTKTYNNNSSSSIIDWGYSVAQTSDGEYIIAGYTGSYDLGFDVYLIKTDNLGDTVWAKTYAFSSRSIDEGYSVAQTRDGGYIIVGSTWTLGVSLRDVYLIKTDANGNTLWTKTYGGSEDDVGYSVVQTGDGGYMIAGWTGSYGTGGDVYLIRTDTKGDTLWTKTIGGKYWDYSYSIVQTTDGGYIIAGGTYSYGPEIPDYPNVYLIKLAPETGAKENSNPIIETPNLHLGQNPFSTATTISYQIPERSKVSLSVYDITGREIKRLVDGVQERGEYHLQLDMTGYAEGVYFCRLETKDYQVTQKMVRVR